MFAAAAAATRARVRVSSLRNLLHSCPMLFINQPYRSNLKPCVLLWLRFYVVDFARPFFSPFSAFLPGISVFLSIANKPRRISRNKNRSAIARNSFKFMPFYVFFTFANRFAHKGSPPPPPCFFAVTPFASFSRVFVRLIQLTLPRTDASELVLHKHKREISRYCTTELSSQAGGHTTHIKLFFSSQPTSSSIMCNTEATSRG